VTLSITRAPDEAGTRADLEPVTDRPPTHVRRRRRGPTALALVALAVAQAVVALDLDLPVLRPVLALATFVALPTLVVHRRATWPADTAVARLGYALGLSVLGLLLGGLLLDTVLPWAGVDHPLAPAPLALAWLVADAALLLWRRSVPLLEPGAPRRAVRAAVDARIETAQALAALGLLLAVLGAVRLNNGAGGGVAIASEVLAAGALLALLVGRSTSLGRDVRTLGMVAASLLLATSLRGWNITGHDIQAEFLAFRLTDGAQNWEMSSLPSAYNACLSVNILPTVLAQTTGLSGELVFKVLLQLLFATVPVLTFLLGRRLVSRRLALIGTIFTVAFPTFYTDMPYLVRQEVAFFFLALLLLAATEPGRTRVGTRALVLALGVGVILSHYSTTYVLLMALGAALLAMATVAVVRRRRHLPATGSAPVRSLVLLHPAMVAALVAVTLAWAGPITGTGGHAAEVVRDTVRAVTGHGADEPGSSDTSYWVLSGDQTSPHERMKMFVDDTLDYRNSEIPPAQRVVRHPGPAELSPPLREGGTDALGNALKLGSALIMQVFLLLGMVWLLRRRLRGPDGPVREVTFLAWGAMAALALIVLVPNLSVDYGVLRAFQQTLLVVAPMMALGLRLALRPVARRAPRAAVTLVAGVPIALVLVLTGVLPAVLGSPVQRMALANHGSYYDRFFASDAEMRGLSWLGSVDHADRTNERLIASRNINVRLLGLSQNRAPVSDRLYPTLLSKDAYVFVDQQILRTGASTIFYTGDLLSYAYPLRDVDRHMNLVYSSPDARVYR
jgi:uncharacterized membrane protein